MFPCLSYFYLFITNKGFLFTCILVGHPFKILLLGLLNNCKNILKDRKPLKIKLIEKNNALIYDESFFQSILL